MVPGNPGSKASALTSVLARVRRWVAGSRPFRLEMIRAAARAPRLLGESTGLVRCFVLSRQNADGGFQDRSGRSDLYYTAFALQTLLALRTPWPPEPLQAYLAAFGDGAGLDFVHLCCLARCRALIGKARDHQNLILRIESYRCADGGYHPTPGSPQGTAYAAFLALGAYQDLKTRLPAPNRLADSLKPLAQPEGGWANERLIPAAAVNATAAALGVLVSLGNPVPEAARWLLAQAHPLGGFRASPLAPLPDLLSTATALQTLAVAGVPLDAVREPCLDFIDSLWSNVGGFHGHWHDEIADVEYTFYGLLALGLLAR